MDEVINKVDQTPWLRRTGWVKMFVGQDMKILVQGIQRPREDAFLELIWSIIIQVVKERCMKSVVDCNQCGWSKLLY
jgi:hypothetical protein